MTLIFKVPLILIAILTGIFIFSCHPSPEIKRISNEVLVISSAKVEGAGENISSALSDHTIISSLDPILEDSLLAYSTLIFHNSNWDSLSPYAQSLVERYVQMGNGIILQDCKKLSHPLQWPWMASVEEKLDSINNSNSALLNYDGGRIAISTAQSKIADFNTLITQCIGNNSYNPSLAISLPAPDNQRFNVRLLSPELFEPMEMVVLPNLDVLLLERRGKIKLYKAATGKTIVVNEFDVCTEGNYEDGLHGLALDPRFGRDNDWIYLYYSPPCDNPNQLLSRFEFKNDSLVRDSEVQIMEVKVQRETCCHSGGFLEFDRHGNLWLSTGDNSISTESDGFSPIDERPGKYYNDAQKSSGNTNDLRGKILRITPQPDGSYTIPAGNLFPTSAGIEGRPEIYVMGCRNPFRVGIDQKRDFIVWGEVGPDGREAGPEGPLAYDEFNLATKPGNYGWPHFVANNLPYAERDFDTGKINDLFDPKGSKNDSPNNTGASILPPAQAALIYYPYAASEKFPMLGSGGRSAMGGPTYYDDFNFAGSRIALPAYYNGKTFIYDWVRNWIKLLTIDDDGKMQRIEPFLPKEKFYGIIDMQVGPEGALYVMEYGNGYFLKNPEARLVRIEYHKGNQAPVAKMEMKNPAGVAPLQVQFSAKKSYDPDQQDSLIYNWYFNDDNIVDAIGPEAHWTFVKKGAHLPKLEVIDPAGTTANCSGKVIVGNAPPIINIDWPANQTFAFANQKINYQVNIKDEEDEENGGIQKVNATVEANYSADNDYVYQIIRGEKTLPKGSLIGLEGKKLINNNDCRSCHLDKKKSNGPSYMSVAARYDDAPITKETLISKIIHGGVGNWGQKPMAAHPELSEADASKMVDYILNIDKSNSIPTKGILTIDPKINQQGAYFFTAAYLDQGYQDIPPLQSRKVLVLRSPKLQTDKADEQEGMWPGSYGDGKDKNMLIVTKPGFIKYNQLDLTGINAIEVHFATRLNCQMECRIDAPDGPIIGRMNFPNGNNGESWESKKLTLNPTSGFHDVYFTFKKEDLKAGQNNFVNIGWFQFHTN